MIVYEKEQMTPSVTGKYPTLDFLYNTIIRENRLHMERVGRYCDVFYRYLWEIQPELMSQYFDEAFSQVSEQMFCLHDLGRVYIPNTILNKVEALTTEERQIINNHTIYARDAVKAVYKFPFEGELLNKYLNIALFHHERFDGGGYPNGLAGEDIPLEARICAVADVYDGITSWKPYKTRQTSREKAAEIIMSEAGKQFDPQLTKRFVEVIPRLPD